MDHFHCRHGQETFTWLHTCTGSKHRHAQEAGKQRDGQRSLPAPVGGGAAALAAAAPGGIASFHHLTCAIRAGQHS